MDFLTQIKLPIEAISHTADADQMPRHCGIVLNLFPQCNNVVVHHAVGHENAGAPHCFEQVLARKHASPAADERRQQLQLGVGGFQLLALAAQLETPQVQLEAAEAIHLTARLGFGSAKHGPDARTQFTRLNGLVT